MTNVHDNDNENENENENDNDNENDQSSIFNLLTKSFVAPFENSNIVSFDFSRM